MPIRMMSNMAISRPYIRIICIYWIFKFSMAVFYPSIEPYTHTAIMNWESSDVDQDRLYLL